MPRILVLLPVFTALALAGCGKKDAPPEPAPEAPAPAAQQAPEASATEPGKKPAPQPAAKPEAPTDEFDAGIQEVRRLEEDADFTKALRLCRQLRSKFRSHERVDELDELSVRLQEGKRAGVALRVAIQNLGATDIPTRQAARIQLSGAGESGRILLRKSIRTENGDVAVEAANLLTRLKDARAVPSAIVRLQSDVEPAVARAIGEILRAVRGDLTAEQLVACHALIREDSAFSRKEVGGALQAVFDDTCGGDAAAYTERVGQPGAAAELRDYIERAVPSPDPAIRDWVCAEGGSAAGYIDSLRGRYYHGREHDPKRLVREQFDRTIKFYNSFGYLSNRYTDISARWDGYIDVPADGDYGFDLTSYDRTRVWIDDVLLLYSSSGKAVKTNRTLQAGMRHVRIDFMNASSTASIDFGWRPPKGGRTINLPYRAAPRPGILTNLQASVASFATNDLNVIYAAKARLRQGAGTSTILLRDAVLKAEPEIARQAADFLADLRDERTPALLLQRAQAEPDIPVRMELYRALRRMGQAIPGELLSSLLADVRAADGSAMKPGAIALCAVLEARCFGKADAFNEVTADAKAYDDLKAFVMGCLDSKDIETVKIATAFGTPFAPYLAGLEKRYFTGRMFDRPMRSRLIPRVQLVNRQWQTTSNIQDNVSVRYTGLINVTNAASYTFHLRSDDPGRIRVGDAYEMRSPPSHAWVTSSVSLQVAAHPFEVQSGTPGSNNRVEGHWSTPAGANVGATYLARPWPAAVEECASAVSDLTSTNAAVSERARQMLHHYDPAGRVVLRHALRAGDAATAGAAALVLARYSDADALPLIIARLDDARGIPADPFVTAIDLMSHLVTPELAAKIAGSLPGGEWKDLHPRAAVLSLVLDREFAGDTKAFDAAAGVSGLAGKLKPYFERLMTSDSVTNAAWAVQYGGGFVPRMQGLHAQYYFGRNFDAPAVDYRLGTASIGNRRFPTPGSRQDNISARWTGFLNVEKAGEYTFYLTGDDRAALRIDGKQLVVSTANKEQQAKITLKPGLVPIQVDYQQSTSTAILTLRLSGPGINKGVLSQPFLRSNARLSQLQYLHRAVDKLVPLKANQYATGDKVLLDYHDTGRLVARNALRHGTNVIAAAGAGFLRRHVDPEFGSIAVQRLSEGSASLVTTSVVANIVRYTNVFDTADLKGFHDLLIADKKHEMRGLVLLFDRVLAKESGGDAAAFGKRVGQPRAFQNLQTYIKGGAASADEAVSKWFVKYTGDLYPIVGVTREFFSGGNFEKSIKKELAPAVGVEPKTFPYPANARPEQVSARWSGYLRPPGKGGYVFIYTGIGKTQLWINNAAVGSGASVNLQGGAHEFKFELSGSTNATAKITWRGPEVPKDAPIPKSALRALP